MCMRITFSSFSFSFHQKFDISRKYDITQLRSKVFRFIQHPYISFIIWKKEKFIEKFLFPLFHLNVISASRLINQPRFFLLRQKRIQRLINKSSDPRRLCRNVFLLLWNPKSNEVTNPSSRKKLEILENFKKKKFPFHFCTNIQQQGNEKNDEIVRKFYLKITWKCPIL